MEKVVYPITWLAGREGEAADVIHDIAVEMMEHRADLLRNTTGASESECQVYLKQISFFEEYATVLNAIYYQMEPTKWDPETPGEVLELAQAYHIQLPGWMLPDRMIPGKTQDSGHDKDTKVDSVDRLENEGGQHKLSHESSNMKEQNATDHIQ